MNYLPILIDIRNQEVLVIGEGQLAAHKARSALRVGAKVTFVARADTPTLESLIAEPMCRHLNETFNTNHLRGARLVFAATVDEMLTRDVSRAAREVGIPVNVADRTSLCLFIMPATVARGPIRFEASATGDVNATRFCYTAALLGPVHSKPYSRADL